MSTLADVLKKVEELEGRAAEAPSAEILALVTAIDKNSDPVLPTEFVKLIDLARDQNARWYARWQFSAMASPDSQAEAETVAWNNLWKAWTDTLCEKAPEARGPLARAHKLALVHRVLERRELGLREHRVMEVVVSIVSRVAIVLNDLHLGFVARPLYSWSLFPPGTVGRVDTQPSATPTDGADRARLTDDASKLLIQAATLGDVASVERLLSIGANVNARDETEGTAVMAAAANGKNEVVTRLIARGADLSVRNKLGGTVLHMACFNGSPSTVSLLIAAGANREARDKYGRTCIFDTLYVENTPVLEWLLVHGEDPEVRGDSGDTPLLMAAAVGKVKAVEALLAGGASIEARNKEGETPLLASLSHSHAAVATVLLDRGANAQFSDSAGRTALHHAAFGGLIGLCGRLLRLGLDANATDDGGDTPLHVAAFRGFPTIQRMLLEAGGNTLLKSSEGKSVHDLERGAAELRRITEELRLLRALPPAISVEDMRRLSALLDRRAAAGESDTEAAWHELRAFLEDLLHAYRVNPARAGQDPIAVERIIETISRVHPGET